METSVKKPIGCITVLFILMSCNNCFALSFGWIRNIIREMKYSESLEKMTQYYSKESQNLSKLNNGAKESAQKSQKNSVSPYTHGAVQGTKTIYKKEVMQQNNGTSNENNDLVYVRTKNGEIMQLPRSHAEYLSQKKSVEILKDIKLRIK